MDKLVENLKIYADEYKKLPFGREIEGTPELLEQAAQSLTEAKQSIDEFRKKFVDGLNVHSQGDDESDGMECPVCHYEVARNDDYPEMRPKHCPECGTKLIY